MSRLQEAGRVIELRSYQTVHGIWNYFTVDDGQVDLANDSYLLVGTLESYRKVQAYYGLEQVIPIYVEVEDGLRPVSYTHLLDSCIFADADTVFRSV